MIRRVEAVRSDLVQLPYPCPEEVEIDVEPEMGGDQDPDEQR